MTKRGYYIWINGFPGVGKLTVATELQRLLPGSLLIDNHQLIDVVKLPRDHPQYNTQRERVRQEAFRKWVHPDGDEESSCGSRDERLGRIVIFTDFLTSNKLGTAWSTEHKVAAEKAGRPFLPIYLVCSKEENLARVASPERTQRGSEKLCDVDMVGRFLDKLAIYRFPGRGVEVDVTELAPGEAAGRIVEAINDDQL
ncbi:hypothetical protein TOPH_03362 [Tolypocladium ophioglossoides CBS 100239]|uniref:Uncharacterized protein n=1 Tax=Tolypocladium ophioglossoides (strain CBS 100239) TaxID=1163406 RepID=A0A0L0NCP5_TOLOC|nr:hypothetical protein TOPH_03362 [Tolypocladium ophioglossoides CBS 100239]